MRESEKDDILFSYQPRRQVIIRGQDRVSPQFVHGNVLVILLEDVPAVSSQKSSQKIIELIMENAGITTQQMADNLGISRRAVAKTIAKLQAEEIIRRVGPDKGGHWEIVKNE